MIPTCLHMTQPWSMTMRERAHWQAASAPLLRAALMETKTMTTSTTGDHAFRNWPTCMTHVKVSPPVRDTDHAWGVLPDTFEEILVQAFNWMCLRFYWGSFGHKWENGLLQSFVGSSGNVNETVKSCVDMISHKERSCACYEANTMCVEMCVHVWFCLS